MVTVRVHAVRKRFTHGTNRVCNTSPSRIKQFGLGHKKTDLLGALLYKHAVVRLLTRRAVTDRKPDPVHQTSWLNFEVKYEYREIIIRLHTHTMPYLTNFGCIRGFWSLQTENIKCIRMYNVQFVYVGIYEYIIFYYTHMSWWINNIISMEQLISYRRYNKVYLKITRIVFSAAFQKYYEIYNIM